MSSSPINRRYTISNSLCGGFVELACIGLAGVGYLERHRRDLQHRRSELQGRDLYHGTYDVKMRELKIPQTSLTSIRAEWLYITDG
jgi:hypothetical protein